MGLSLIFEHYPNKLPWSAVPNDTNWHLCAFNSSGVPTLYEDYDAMNAAGGKPYPGLDNAGRIGRCLIRSATSAGAAGAAVYFALNRTDAPVDTNADNIVGGSNQQISLDCPFRSIWIKATTGTDRVFLDGAY